MKAIVQDTYGAVDVLELKDIDKPETKDDRVLVRIHAAGVDPSVWHVMTGEPYLVRLMGYGPRRARNAGRWHGEVWEQYLSEPIDPTRLIILDQGAYEAEASVLVVQALHQGNAHREQICSILTTFGLEPPDIQAWAYAEAAGRARERIPTDWTQPAGFVDLRGCYSNLAERLKDLARELGADVWRREREGRWAAREWSARR